MRFFLSLILMTQISCLAANENLARNFTLHKLNENDKNAPTLLLIGGIHGDEAGAYYATDIFIRHYKITKGSVWVVPVANPHGMFANKRGVYGDMNRKFASLSANDPDYNSIQKIKDVVTDPHIDISMHLHDGSGYWRPKYINDMLSPYRWGNCSVIDQEELKDVKYGKLENFVAQMVADINQHIIKPIHRYHVNNTHTKAKNDVEQLNALTFFSLSNGKPALTNEASKELDIPTRIFYHLLAIESLLGQLGIHFERNFTLSVDSIKTILSPENFNVKIENHTAIPLESLRPHIAYFPLPKKTSLKSIQLNSQSELMGLVNIDNNRIALKYGSRTLSTISPEYFDFDTSLTHINIFINGEKHSAPIGSIVYVGENDSIEFEKMNNYRVNIIGFVAQGAGNPPDESGIKIFKKNLMPRYSIDTESKIYRAEIYHSNAFSGTITLAFKKPKEEKTQNYHHIAYKPAPLSQVAKVADLPKATPKAETNVLFIRSAKGVNIRLSPDTQSPIIAKIPQGTQVTLIKNEGKWSNITYNQTSTQKHVGYVITNALTQNMPNHMDTLVKTNIVESSPKQIKNQKVRVKVNAAFVRLAPTINSNIVAKAPLGREMEILSLSEDGEWAKIHYIFIGKNGPREINGYVAKHLLTP